MKEFFDALLTAWPIVATLALMLWALIVFHGDARWAKTEGLYDKNGDAKWVNKDTLAPLQAVVMGQNDKLGDHESRITKMEERNEILLSSIDERLTNLQEKVEDTHTRIIRIETRRRADVIHPGGD